MKREDRGKKRVKKRGGRSRILGNKQRNAKAGEELERTLKKRKHRYIKKAGEIKGKAMLWKF